jgi:hypothetical protein
MGLAPGSTIPMETMRTRPFVLAVGGVGTTFFVALAVFSQLHPGTRGGVRLTKPDPLVALFFLGFAALGLWLVCSYFFDRIVLELQTVPGDRIEPRTRNILSYIAGGRPSSLR